MSVLANVVRQSILMCVSATVGLAVVVVIAIAGEMMGVMMLAEWFGHGGLFAIPWVFLTVLIYIPLVLVDDRRQSKSH
jgi:hypothetical protein